MKGWATDRETFLWQFHRRLGNYIVQHRPIHVPPVETLREVLRLGPLRSDR